MAWRSLLTDNEVTEGWALRHVDAVYWDRDPEWTDIREIEAADDYDVDADRDWVDYDLYGPDDYGAEYEIAFSYGDDA